MESIYECRSCRQVWNYHFCPRCQRFLDPDELWDEREIPKDGARIEYKIDHLITRDVPPRHERYWAWIKRKLGR